MLNATTTRPTSLNTSTLVGSITRFPALYCAPHDRRPKSEIDGGVFENEKDHLKSPSPFELNYGYGEVVAAADQIQLDKLIAARLHQHGLTASSCPSPSSASTVRHAHQTVHRKGGQELCSGIRKAGGNASTIWWSFVDRIFSPTGMTLHPVNAA